MSDEQILNIRIKQEFENPIYDCLDEAIIYTSKKQNYKKYDLVKLIMMIYDRDYSFISNYNDYREQFKLLDDYFIKTYNHSIITFLMIKEILKYKGTKVYEPLVKDIAFTENLFRTKKNTSPEDLCLFSYPIDNESYNDLMTNIETNISFKYALAILYDRIKMSI